ncbi:MAG: SRPBCC family protein [Rhodospirillales bacterium]
MWGELAAAGATKILTFERDFARPVEKVWAALVTPTRISDWLCADAEVEPRAGGRFHLVFRNGPHIMSGVITRFEPPHLLEYTWPESAANGHSIVRWDLSAIPAGTRLVLTHTLPAGGALADFASGWHWHLDALADAVDGTATPWNRAQWQTLQSAYLTRLAEGFSGIAPSAPG